MSEAEQENGTDTIEETDGTDTGTETPIEGDDGDTDGDEDGSGDEDGGDEDGDEDETPTDLASGPTDAEIQKALDRIERRGKTYGEFVTVTAGEIDQPLVRCPVCIPFVPGFIFDPNVVPLAPGQEAGARLLLGDDLAPQYAQAPNAQQCPTCNGFGKVRTGSRVEAKGLLACPECRGLGFIGEAANLTPAQVAGTEEIPLQLVPSPDFALPDEDQWGTPRDHPDFGKMPQYREPDWAAALDAFKRSTGRATVQA